LHTVVAGFSGGGERQHNLFYVVEFFLQILVVVKDFDRDLVNCPSVIAGATTATKTLGATIVRLV
jgi:hypothetical protein